MPPELAQSLDLAGYPWKAVADEAGRRVAPSPTTAGRAPSSWPPTTPRVPSRSAGPCASATSPSSRCCSWSPARSSPTSSSATTSSTTSASTRSSPASSRRALKHLFWRTGRGTRPELVEYGDLLLNLETYQAAIAGKPLDLTYMEYELLKFLASHPGKVFTRETLLSRVWGYEYYGGARTVDVHIRRLRAKLGEEHANLIQTVRSVGYRFGQSRWGLSSSEAELRRLTPAARRGSGGGAPLVEAGPSGTPLGSGTLVLRR